MTGMIMVLLTVNTLLLAVVVWLVVGRRDAGSLTKDFETLEKGQERTERVVREDISKNREELTQNLALFGESMNKQLAGLTQSNEDKLEKLRESVEKRLEYLQEDNSRKLEKMRETVDEKLHSTLEKRLGESFKLVDEQLSQVHKDLGEMRNLAVGVGDLKKVLTNVKTRGTWGEVQLGSLLEQVLTPEQYEKNVVTKKGSKDPVEFAIVFPKGERLPIDAKFPQEDYQRLQAAQEAGSREDVEDAGRALEQRIKLEAKKIQDKYLDPPHTTDFAVLFLATEGLYAEVISRPGLCDLLQRDYRVTVAGPTTIAALLNSFQMGFRTLAVEKRASEVWKHLIVVKTEFGKFGSLLDKTQKKLQEASNTIEQVQSKSRNIESKLDKVQQLPGNGRKSLPAAADDDGSA